MAHKNLDIKQALLFGWRTVFSKNIFQYILLVLASWGSLFLFLGIWALILPLLMYLMLFLSTLIRLKITDAWAIVGMVIPFLYIFCFFVGLFLFTGWTKVALDFRDRGVLSVKTLFGQWHYLGKMLKTLIWGLPIGAVLGFLALILEKLSIPARLSSVLAPAISALVFILLIRFIFSGYLVFDTNQGGLEVLKKSWDLTEGNVGRLILFGLIIAMPAVLIQALLVLTHGTSAWTIIGLAANLISTLITTIGFFGSAHLYRQLVPAKK